MYAAFNTIRQHEPYYFRHFEHEDVKYDAICNPNLTLPQDQLNELTHEQLDLYSSIRDRNVLNDYNEHRYLIGNWDVMYREACRDGHTNIAHYVLSTEQVDPNFAFQVSFELIIPSLLERTVRHVSADKVNSSMLRAIRSKRKDLIRVLYPHTELH